MLAMALLITALYRKKILFNYFPVNKLRGHLSSVPDNSYGPGSVDYKIFSNSCGKREDSHKFWSDSNFANSCRKFRRTKSSTGQNLKVVIELHHNYVNQEY